MEHRRDEVCLFLKVCSLNLHSAFSDEKLKQMENLQSPIGGQISGHSNIHQDQDTHPMEHWHTVTEDNEAVLSLLQYEKEHLSSEESNAAHSEKRKELTEAPLQHDQTVRIDDLQRLDAENTVETSQASVHSLPKLHEELEESHQGFQPTFEDPGPSVLLSDTHIHNIWHPPNLLHFPTSVHQDKQNPASPLNIKPVTLFADISPSFHVHPHVMPHFNPVLVPHLSPNVLSNASVPRHNPFCPINTPQLNFNLPFKPNFTTLVACGDPIRSSLVFRPHLNVYSAHPRPNIYQMIRTDGSGRFPPELQDSFRLWQRLCETARLFCSSGSDAEALACYFISVVPSLAGQHPDLPFSAAVNTAVQQWRKTSNIQRQQYYNTAKMFIEMEEQDKTANREKEDPMFPQTHKHQGGCSGKVKKTAKRCKKEPPVLDLAESALTEYSQVMDALGSKVTEGSEVTAADEEDVCALFLNQLLNDSESTTEAGFDMDYINSLLSTDVFTDNSQDIPEPIAGCSDWTRTTVSEAQIQPSSALKHDFSTDLLFSEDHVTENIHAFQDNNQNAFQMFTEPLLANPELQSSQTDLNASIQETPDLQEFDPEADGNHKDETELDSDTQSNRFNLQNYKSHHATFPQTDPEPPEILVDGELEHDGEESTVVGPKTEQYMNQGRSKDNNKTDSDIPNDSQKTRSVCNKQTNLKESLKIDQIEENNVNKNKKHKRRHRRRKHTETTLPKSDDNDERRLKTAEYQPGKTQRKSANATKRDAREQKTDFIKINMKRVELQNITEATSSGRCANLRKIRAEHLDDEFERRQRQLKTVRRVGKRQMTKAETYGGRPKKQESLLIEEDRGDFRHKTEACQRLRRELRPKHNVGTINVSEKVDEITI